MLESETIWPLNGASNASRTQNATATDFTINSTYTQACWSGSVHRHSCTSPHANNNKTTCCGSEQINCAAICVILSRPVRLPSFPSTTRLETDHSPKDHSSRTHRPQRTRKGGFNSLKSTKATKAVKATEATKPIKPAKLTKATKVTNAKNPKDIPAGWAAPPAQVAQHRTVLAQRRVHDTDE